jgi:hypothetical protein
VAAMPVLRRVAVIHGTVAAAKVGMPEAVV